MAHRKKLNAAAAFKQRTWSVDAPQKSREAEKGGNQYQAPYQKELEKLL